MCVCVIFFFLFIELIFFLLFFSSFAVAVVDDVFSFIRLIYIVCLSCVFKKKENFFSLDWFYIYIFFMFHLLWFVCILTLIIIIIIIFRRRKKKMFQKKDWKLLMDFHNEQMKFINWLISRHIVHLIVILIWKKNCAKKLKKTPNHQ